MLKHGLRCFDIYKVTLAGTPRNLRNGTTAKFAGDEKETVELFAGLFSAADIYTFREVFGTRMDLLVAKIMDNNLLLTIPQVRPGIIAHTYTYIHTYIRTHTHYTTLTLTCTYLHRVLKKLYIDNII